MKKVFITCLLLICFFAFMPMVKADAPETNSVTYFLVYPNGDEDAYASPVVAQDIKEKLLYDGYTDENGEILLTDWRDSGEIRIVQEVPNGYTTNTREVKVDLSEANGASLVDYRGLTNPGTGRSFLMALILIVVLGSSFVIIRMNKKSVLLIPIGLIAFSCLSVHAWTNSFVIRVVDGKGDPLKNVHVYVYGKPVIETAPAIYFDANGGHFFDGKTSFYVRIPYNGCSFETFLESLSEEMRSYLTHNFELAYREGYTPTGFDMPSVLNNGDSFLMNWTVSDMSLMHIVGNGGTYNFYGQQLSSLYLYSDRDIEYFVSQFNNRNSHYTGADTNSSCSNYNSYGVMEDDLINNPDVAVYYLCWNSKPDGVYVNDEAFVGSVDTCFNQAHLMISEDELELFTYYDSIYLGKSGTNDLDLYYYHENSVQLRKEKMDGESNRSSDPITSIEIIYHGQRIFYVGENDMTVNGIYYRIKDKTKTSFLLDYLDNLYDACSAFSPQ